MLRYAISGGQSAFDPAARTRLNAQAQSLAAQRPRQRVDFFLLREPALPAGELAAISREILTIFANTPTRLLIHSRPDIAIATSSHGVHLPSALGSLTPTEVRTLYACANLPVPAVSLSCHTAADLLRARDIKPDLILYGPIFGKMIANQLITAPLGLEALREACHLASPIPVLALGGITAANTPACLEAGAAGIAAIRLFSAKII